MYNFLVAKWGFDAVLGGLAIWSGLSLGHQLSRSVDIGFFELAGPHGLSTVLPGAATRVAGYDNALVTTFALNILLGLVVVVASVYTSMAGTDTLGLVLVSLVGLAV